MACKWIGRQADGFTLDQSAEGRPAPDASSGEGGGQILRSGIRPLPALQRSRSSQMKLWALSDLHAAHPVNREAIDESRWDWKDWSGEGDND